MCHFLRRTTNLSLEVPGHAAVRGNEIVDKLARDDSVQKFDEPKPSLGISRQNIKAGYRRKGKTLVGYSAMGKVARSW